MSSPEGKHWEEIHKKCAEDPEFRALLETDPRAALDKYAKDSGIEPFKKIVSMPEPSELDKYITEGGHSAPPACC
jgi:hypothetical protein